MQITKGYNAGNQLNLALMKTAKDIIFNGVTYTWYSNLHLNRLIHHKNMNRMFL